MDNPYKPTQVAGYGNSPYGAFLPPAEDRSEPSYGAKSAGEYREATWQRKEKQFIETDVPQPYNIFPSDFVRCMNCDHPVRCSELSSHLITHGAGYSDAPTEQSSSFPCLGACCDEGVGDTNTLREGVRFPASFPNFSPSDQFQNFPPKMIFKVESEKRDTLSSDIAGPVPAVSRELPQQINPIYEARSVPSKNYTYQHKKPAKYAKQVEMDWEGAPATYTYNEAVKIKAKPSAPEPNFDVILPALGTTVVPLVSDSLETKARLRRPDSSAAVQLEGQHFNWQGSAPLSLQMARSPNQENNLKIGNGKRVPVVFVPQRQITEYTNAQQHAGCADCGQCGGCSCSVSCCSKNAPGTHPVYPAELARLGIVPPAFSRQVSRAGQPDGIIVGQSRYSMADKRLLIKERGTLKGDQPDAVRKQVIDGKEVFVMTEEEIRASRMKSGTLYSQRMSYPLADNSQVGSSCFSCKVSCCDGAGGERPSYVQSARVSKTSRVRYVPVMAYQPVIEQADDESSMVPITLEEYQKMGGRQLKNVVTAEDADLVLEEGLMHVPGSPYKGIEEEDFEWVRVRKERKN